MRGSRHGLTVRIHPAEDGQGARHAFLPPLVRHLHARQCSSSRRRARSCSSRRTVGTVAAVDLVHDRLHPRTLPFGQVVKSRCGVCTVGTAAPAPPYRRSPARLSAALSTRRGSEPGLAGHCLNVPAAFGARRQPPESPVELQDTLVRRSHTEPRRRRHDVTLSGRPESSVLKGWWLETPSFQQSWNRAPLPVPRCSSRGSLQALSPLFA